MSAILLLVLAVAVVVGGLRSSVQLACQIYTAARKRHQRRPRGPLQAERAAPRPTTGRTATGGAHRGD